TDSDELALMFRNSFAPAYYKQLHRYVHKNYQKHLSIQIVKQLLAKPARTSFHKIRKAFSLLYYVPASWLAGLRLKKLDFYNK
nr:hypothetical protein [Chitinophagaceae bacterium]